MKKQILLTAMLLITTTTACAQFNIKIGSGKTFRKDTIDQAVLMVQYEVDGCTDTLSEERFQETMMLEMLQVLQLHKVCGRLGICCRHCQ